MLCQLREIASEVKEPPWNNVVGGNIVAKFKGSSSHRNSRGSAISPVMAVAAGVTGLPRYIKELGLPIRPWKLRLAVERQDSPSPSTPWCTPTQAAQPGGVTSAPAWRKVWI